MSRSTEQERSEGASSRPQPGSLLLQFACDVAWRWPFGVPAWVFVSRSSSSFQDWGSKGLDSQRRTRTRLDFRLQREFFLLLFTWEGVPLMRVARAACKLDYFPSMPFFLPRMITLTAEFWLLPDKVLVYQGLSVGGRKYPRLLAGGSDSAFFLEGGERQSLNWALNIYKLNLQSTLGKEKREHPGKLLLIF